MIHDFNGFCNERYYVGQKVANANPVAAQKLATAQSMAVAGHDQEAIRQETGWFTGKFDQKWRYELAEHIDLSKVKFRKNYSKLGSFFAHLDLDEFVTDPLFFEAYPDIRKAMVSLQYGEGIEEKGAYSPAVPDNDQYFGRCMEIMVSAPTKDLLISCLVHEIQHAIQESEGFEEGDNPLNHQYHYDSVTGIAGERTPDEAFKRYLDAPGEIEARDVASRRKLSPEERKSKQPYTSEKDIYNI